jgi:hypothetical protein
MLLFLLNSTPGQTGVRPDAFDTGKQHRMLNVLARRDLIQIKPPGGRRAAPTGHNTDVS